MLRNVMEEKGAVRVGSRERDEQSQRGRSDISTFLEVV